MRSSSGIPKPRREELQKRFYQENMQMLSKTSFNQRNSSINHVNTQSETLKVLAIQQNDKVPE